MRLFPMILSVTSLLFAFTSATGQQLAPASSIAPSAPPSVEPSPPALDEEIVPTFETRKLARTYIIDIPAPRSQVRDRTGAHLAVHLLSSNLPINFRTQTQCNDAQTFWFALRCITP